MTLAETKNREQSTDKGKPMNISEALKTSVKQAAESGRTTCGVYQSANVMASTPDHVMMCVLPEKTSSVVSSTHQKLIEAYCREHRIKILKVKRMDRLSDIISKSCKLQGQCGVKCTELDCILIHLPLKLSKEDEFVITFHDTVTYCQVFPYPCIEIPG